MSTRPPDPAILEHHVAFVRSVARAALAGDAESEDVAQDAWVAALQGAPDELRSPKAWLARVTRRQAALRIRRRSRERRRIAEAARRWSARPAYADSAADAVARAEIGRQLVDAVLELPEIYRAVLLLRHHDSLPPREVARRLDIPVETVRTRTRRGLVLLRERLDAVEGERGADWRASLLLLLPDVPVGVSTSLGVLVGAALMKKSILSALLTLLLLGGVALVWRPWSEEVPAASRAESAHLQAGATSSPPAKPAAPYLSGRVRDAAPRGDDQPPPTDLSSIDRQRDLHGVVRDDETGQPVVNAVLELTTGAWDRSSTFDDRLRMERITRAETRSAADGSWRLRLKPGEVGDLRVRATGYSEHLVRSAQAGERTDLTLQRGTTLRVRVVDPRGQVLPNATVRVFQPNRSSTDGHGFPALRGVTDADGIYVANGLPRGVVTMIDVSHPTHGSAMWHEARAPEKGTDTIEIAMPPSRVLSGRVTDARTGEPVAGARVGIGWMLDAPVQTRADGTYELPGWTAQGVHEIAVHAEGYAGDECLVGARTHIDFALAAETRLRGRIVDDLGRPVAGVQVSAVGSSEETGRQIISSGAARADEVGRFLLRGLRHDMPHRLILVARGFGRTVYDVQRPAQAGRTRDLGDLHIHPAGVIAGEVLRPDGAPLARFPVKLEGANGDRESLLDATDTLGHDYGLEEERYTDDLGRVRFRDMAPGTYTLSVRMPGGPSVEKRVVLSREALAASVRITVEEGRLFTVCVQETGGAPIDQATVFVTTAGGKHVSGATDASGRAQFRLPDAPATVRCSTAFEISRKRYIEPPETEVSPGAQEIVLRVMPAEVIRGRVVDEQDRPLARVTLRALHDGKAVADGWTRTDGTFRLTVPAGAVLDLELIGTRLQEAGAGMIARAAFLSGGVKGVKAGDDNVSIRAHTVPHDRTITIKVTDPRGRPLPGSRVYVTREGGEFVTAVLVGAEGKVEIRELPQAELVFAAARAPGAREAGWVLPARVRALPHAQAITLAYRPGASVEGIVVNAQGEAVAGARVAVEFEDGAYQAMTDAGGRFVAHVPASENEVTVRLLTSGQPNTKDTSVRARPGDTDIRLVAD